MGMAQPCLEDAQSRLGEQNYRTVKLYYSSEHHTLYNRTEGYTIPLQARIGNPVQNQGRQFFLNEASWRDSANPVEEQDEQVLNKTEFNKIQEKLSMKFGNYISTTGNTLVYNGMKLNDNVIDHETNARSDFINDNFFAHPTFDNTIIENLIRIFLRTMLSNGTPDDIFYDSFTGLEAEQLVVAHEQVLQRRARDQGWRYCLRR